MSIWQGLILNGTEVINNPWIVGNVYLNTKGVIDTTNAYTGIGTATSGAPRIFLGTNVSSGDDSAILIGRALVGTNLFSHAIRDESTFVSATDGAYAAFDAATVMSGATVYNHLHGFQCRSAYSGSTTLLAYQGFSVNPVINSGTATYVNGLHVYDAVGAGSVNYQIGVYIDHLTKGTLANYAIYSPGDTISYHAGQFQVGAGGIYNVGDLIQVDNATNVYGQFHNSVDDGLLLALGNQNNLSNRHFIITDYANILKDHDHDTLSTNPALFIHSATDPDINNAQWLRLNHNQVNAEIFSGTGYINVSPGICFLDLTRAIWGTSAGGMTFYYDPLVPQMGAFLSNTHHQLILSTGAFPGKNFDHPAQANPTLFIHSATDPDVNHDQWLSATHNQTNAVIATGAGDLILDPITEITEVCGVGLKTKEYNATLNNAASISLPAGTGWGTFMIGDNQEYARVRWTSAAVPTIDESTANVAGSDVAGNLCFIDGGGTITIKNNLGSNLTLRYVIHYS